MREMLRDERGFTLIELVMIIVILGVLAAVAIPTYVNLSGTANRAAVDGVAGGMGSAMAVNYAARSINVANGVAITNCTSVGGAMAGGVPTGYTITALAIAAGATATCTVTHDTNLLTATFPGIGIL